MNVATGCMPVRSYVGRLEGFCVEFFKKCEMKTNQFSTKYVLQKAISEHRRGMDELANKVATLGADPVNINNFEQMLDTFTQDNLKSDLDEENLNFVEATKLAIIIMEFVIDKYEQLLQLDITSESKNIVADIITVKQKHLSLLKSEYEKVRYK